MNCFPFISVLLLLMKQLASAQDYYWRDYTGSIPYDAVPGGRDERGHVTFIGQALHPCASLTPGTIKKSYNFVYYSRGGREYSQQRDIKVLCARNPNQLTWVRAERGQPMETLSNRNVVVGGHDEQDVLAIGRRQISEREVLIGRVPVSRAILGPILLIRNGNAWPERYYEVLVYSPFPPNYNPDVVNPEDCSKQITINMRHLDQTLAKDTNMTSKSEIQTLP